MDKAAEEAARIEGARVDSITDANNLKAIRVTFDSEFYSKPGKATWMMIENCTWKILKKFYWTTQRWTFQSWVTPTIPALWNQPKLSQDRAQSVANFLKLQNVPSGQLKEIVGKDYSMPVADNSESRSRTEPPRWSIHVLPAKKWSKMPKRSKIILKVLIHWKQPSVLKRKAVFPITKSCYSNSQWR